MKPIKRRKEDEKVGWIDGRKGRGGYVIHGSRTRVHANSLKLSHFLF
jgi:hypothetical protein